MTSDKIKVNVAQAIKEVSENLVYFTEVNKLKAKAQREYYLDLVKQGFTEEQSLKIVIGTVVF